MVSSNALANVILNGDLRPLNPKIKLNIIITL